MERKPPEALDDIRKKRLAYFETSVNQSSSENILKNDLEVAGANHPGKGLPLKVREPQSSKTLPQTDKRNESLSQSEYIKSESVEQYRVLKETVAFTPELNSKVEVAQYGKEIDNRLNNRNNDIKRTLGAKTDYIEDKARSNLKTTSFFVSADGIENDHHSSHNINGSYNDMVQAEAKETIQLENENEVRDSRHVHYDDGYNETVERLIKATKEELLGKQVEDDIWLKYRKEQKDTNAPPVKGNLAMRRDSEPVLQEAPVYSSLEPRRHSVIVNNATNPGTIDDIFQSNLTQSAFHTNLSLNESHKSLNSKVDKSETLDDLGLSTHRPDTGKAVQELTIETHGIKLNESLTRQLKYALGEEKFNEFVEKSKKDIDVLQQERVSARGESGKRITEKPDKSIHESVSEETVNKPAVIPSEKKQIAAVVPEDFAPRNDGDAVHDLIGEHLLKKKEPRQKLTSNPAYKQKSVDASEGLDNSKSSIPKKVVPELNLTSVNTSPRPLLNRPKHEPYNIYQEKANKQTDKKIENRVEPLEKTVNSAAKNYEQVTVSRNVMYSADEIYFQAYGKYPENYIESPSVPESPQGMQISQQATHVLVNTQGTAAIPKGILVNQQGVPVTPHEVGIAPTVPMSPHAMPMSPHGIPITPHSISSAGVTTSYNMSMSPQYSPSLNPAAIIPVSVHSAVPAQKHYNVPVPPHFINGHFSSGSDNRGLAGFVSTPPQSPLNTGSMQMPHPPMQPPPTYVQSQQIPVYSTALSAPSTPHYGVPATPQFATGGFPPEHQWMPPTSMQQGVPHQGYPVAYSYPYPVMVMTPHPPQVQPVLSEKAPAEEKSTITDKVEVETTFTSVSQIKPLEEVIIPHPPASKKDDKKRSPRKMAGPDRSAKRHIDGIRQHHEQRRQQQEDEQLTEAQIVEKQRKFAKASIERYFQSLENLYQPAPKLNLDGISDVLSESSEENESPAVKDKLNEIPEVDINKNELNHSEKLDKIFMKTNPDNFDIAEIKSELEIQSERLTNLEKSMSVDETNKLGEETNNKKLAQSNEYGEIDIKTEMKIDIEKYKPVVETNIDVQKTYNIQSVPTKHDIVVAAVDSTVGKPDLKESEKDWDSETLVNTAVTGFTIDAGGVTERLHELGIDPKYVKGELNNNDKSKHNEVKQDGQKVKKGKLLIICPECEGFNKEYMSWCTHCGEMIIGVEPMLVSKNRQGKLRTNPVSDITKETVTNKASVNVSEKVDELNKVNNTQFKPDNDDEYGKPLKLDLGLIKSESPREVIDTKLNVSPNKSDGKDSGRPSSDDQDLLQNRNKIEQEVEDDICETITDPVVKDYVKSHFAKRRQFALENKSLPSSENMKSKVQSWIEEIGISESEPTIAPTLEKAQEVLHSRYQGKNTQKVGSAQDDHVNNKTAQKATLSAHLESAKTLNETKIHHLHLKKDSSPELETVDSTLEPPDIPKFGADKEGIPFDPAELNLKLVSESMDFSQFGSVDFSHVELVNIDVKKAPNEKGDADKARAKQERRNKRGHGAIDVEVFGYEESRECKNSSRGQRLVPILNLPIGSSDEEEGSDQEDITENYHVQNDNFTDVTTDYLDNYKIENYIITDMTEHINEKKVDSFGDAVVKQQHSKEFTAAQVGDTKKQGLGQGPDVGKKDSILYSEAGNHGLATTAWRSMDSVETPGPSGILEEVNERGAAGPAPVIMRPEETEELTDDWQLLFDPALAEDEQQEETTGLEEVETDRDQQPFLMQLVGKKGAKGKRPKSAKSKPVKSKVRQSIEKPGYQRKWTRSSTAWSSYNPGELNTSSSLRISTDTQDQSSDRGEGHDLSVTNGNLSERSVSPARPAGNKGRPASADVYKRKQQKSRPVSAGLRKSRDHSRGKKDKDDDLYELVEHRLPRMGIQELLQDRLASPRSTYDKYLQMTPRIHKGTLSCWQCLPDEILLHIFAYLSQADLTRCAQVCHQFYRVAMDESLWKYITIKKKSDLDDSCLEEISKRHPVSLALIHCHGDQITAKGLRDMFRECADSLKELNISRCSRGALNGDSMLLHAAARCHHITHVDTSWCNVTDSGLMAITNSCNRLESLCINGCQAISNDGLETIIRKHGASLRVLEMFGCFNITPRGLQAVSNNCINLISLHLGQCYKLTDSSIAQLSSSLGRVETLDLRGCKQIKDNCIRRVVKNCTRLKNLSLANCPNITDVSMLEISTYLTDIRSIDLCSCKNITDSSIRALVNTCTNLRHIDISSTGCTHRSVSMIANFCAQRLESLRINFLSDVTEASLIKLAKHCRRLTSVHLYGCPSIKNLDKIKEENPTFTIEM